MYLNLYNCPGDVLDGPLCNCYRTPCKIDSDSDLDDKIKV